MPEGGRMKDAAFYITLGLLLGATGVFLAFPGRYFVMHLDGLGWAICSVFAAMQACVVSVLLRASFTGPGALRKGTTPLQPEVLQREEMVAGVPVVCKYCVTCRLWRPPRAAHCSDCDHCVDCFDHHCPWVGACVGRNNYKFFVLFTGTVFVDCVVTATLCALHLALVFAADKSVYVAENAGTIVVLVISGLMAFPTASLFFYHVSLIGKGKTTREDFKINEAPSPYRRPSACSSVLCGPEYFTPHSVADNNDEDGSTEEHEPDLEQGGRGEGAEEQSLLA